MMMGAALIAPLQPVELFLIGIGVFVSVLGFTFRAGKI